MITNESCSNCCYFIYTTKPGRGGYYRCDCKESLWYFKQIHIPEIACAKWKFNNSNLEHYTPYTPSPRTRQLMLF